MELHPNNRKQLLSLLENLPEMAGLTFPAKSYKSLTVRVSETTFILDN